MPTPKPRRKISRAAGRAASALRRADSVGRAAARSHTTTVSDGLKPTPSLATATHHRPESAARSIGAAAQPKQRRRAVTGAHRCRPHPAIVATHQRSAEWQHALSVVLAERLHARALPPEFAPARAFAARPRRLVGRQSFRRPQKSLPALALLNQIQAQAPFQTAPWLDGILCAPNLDYALAHQSDLQGRQSWLTPKATKSTASA